jgi:hypothetical protein
LGVGQQLGAAMNPDAAALQQQLAQQQMMMQQMMMQMMQNQQGSNQEQQSAQPAVSSSPQSKEEILALIDGLDMKLAAGEISEEVYKRLIAKWQERLDQMS